MSNPLVANPSVGNRRHQGEENTDDQHDQLDREVGVGLDQIDDPDQCDGGRRSRWVRGECWFAQNTQQGNEEPGQEEDEQNGVVERMCVEIESCPGEEGRNNDQRPTNDSKRSVSTYRTIL
jgi:hypothetical protein